MEVGGREFLHLGQLQQTGFSFLYTVGHPPAAASSQMLQDRSLILRRLLKDRSLLEDGVVGPPLDAVDVEAGEAGVTAPDGVCPRPIVDRATIRLLSMASVIT